MPLIRHRKAAFRERTDILFTFIPSELDGDLRMSWCSGMKRDEVVSIGPNLRNRGIYPDTEIFASMLSTITRRTSSRERRAIFQATVQVTYVYTARAHSPTWDTRRARENRLRVGTRNTFLTRSIRVRAHAIATIHKFSRNSPRTHTIGVSQRCVGNYHIKFV